MNVRNLSCWILTALLCASLAEAAESAKKSATQIPPDVENQAQAIEARFNSVLSEECSTKLCTPVGCEIGGFRTLDETQNSSLPGLDVSDEVTAPLQYKLSSMNCAFTYEPSLSDEAVGNLRRRINDKVRTAGVTLVIQGRKLSASSPILQAGEAPKPGAVAQPETFGRELARALPILLYMLTAVAGLLTLIWGYRRLGKPKPATVSMGEEKSAAEVVPEPLPEDTRPVEVKQKVEFLKQIFTAQPEIALASIEPIVAKGEPLEICRVLKHFGPEPLQRFVQNAHYRDLFATVHRRYAESAIEEDPSETLAFLTRLERLVTLAELGRPMAPVMEELTFLRDLEPDEFAPLVADLQDEELMAVLSFVPPVLRAHFLKACEPGFVDDYIRHVLNFPRLSEQTIRQLATKLRDQYPSRHTEIRKVSRNQLDQIEQLMNTLTGTQRRELYATLSKKDPRLYDRLMSEVLLDQALVKVPTPALNDLFLTLTPEESAAYLKNHPDRASLLGKLKVPLAQSIRSRLDANGPALGLNLNFIESEQRLTEQARTRMTEILRDKATRGELNLRGINESVLETV